MGYKDRSLKLAKDKKPAPQYFNPNNNDFEIVQGNGGATYTKVVGDEMVGSFEGTANILKTFTETMTGFVMCNDGADGTPDITFTIGAETVRVKAGEVFGPQKFKPFTQVQVNASVPFRAYGLNGTTGTPSPPPDTTAPIASASPNGGSFLTTQLVTLTANETSTIYYTVNGSIPTETSTVYSGPIPLSTTTTIKFFAKDEADNSSAVQTVLFIKEAIDVTPPVVTASPNGGTFATTQQVLLSSNETSTIYYTLDGSTPTVSSQVYSGPITLSSTKTLKFFGRDTAGNNSTVQTVTFTINFPDTTSPNAVTGLTTGAVTSSSIPVSWTLSTSGDVASQEVAYSADGTNYTVASALVNTSSNSYVVTGLNPSTLYTIRVVAIDGAGNRSTPVTAQATTAAGADTTAPVLTITPAATFSTSQQVTMTTNETATIYYTTDGSTPTTASAVYSTPLNLSSTTTVKAFAKDTAGNSSAIQTVIFTKGVADTTPPVVTASPVAGTFGSAQNVTLTTEAGATIYYTLDGSTPTISSMVYSSAIPISATTTLKYFGKDIAGNSSVVQTQTYTIGVADTTPPVLTITPAATFTTTQQVTMTVNETATIYYTLDGTTPTISSLVYSTPLSLSATTTVKAFAKDTAGNSSAIQTVVFTKDTGSTGYVNDASLLLYQNNPTNGAQISNPQLYFNGTEQFTWAVTVRAYEFNNLLFREKEADATARIRLKVDTANQLDTIFYGKTSGGTDAWATIPKDVTRFIDSTRNVHIAYVRNATHIQLYIDNVLSGQVAYDSTNVFDSSGVKPLQLGGSINGSGQSTTFKNIAYYNRALTTEELTQNYNVLK